MKRSPVSTRLRTAITPLLITGTMGTALAVASSTTPAPITKNLCTSGGNVYTMGTNANTMTAAPAPTRPIAAQIPMNTCLHPCDALYHSQTEACSEPRRTKDSLCMSTRRRLPIRLQIKGSP